jgi:hypothetical protein
MISLEMANPLSSRSTLVDKELRSKELLRIGASLPLDGTGFGLENGSTGTGNVPCLPPT